VLDTMTYPKELLINNHIQHSIFG